MMKLAAAGVVAACALGVSMQAGAAEKAYNINGTLGTNEQSCTQVAWSFAGTDCTYGRNRPGSVPGKWQGPYFSGAHYLFNGTQNQPSYIPTFGVNNPLGGTDPANFIPAASDGKFPATITGLIRIDDNDTPGDATDDIVGGTFIIGPMARNIATGQFTRAVEIWSSMNHTLVDTAVNPMATIANAAGGFDYVVGTRGFPDLICFRYNAADCFPSPNSMTDFNDATFWATIPVNSIGIERSGRMGDPGFVATNPAPVIPTGNLGAVSTATFQGYSCAHNNGAQNDCVVNQLVWGGTSENAGFDNIVMKISTNSGGNQITAASAYFSEEYKILLAAPPHLYDNSSQSGRFTFTGTLRTTVPTAQDFVATVIEDSTVNTLNAAANSVNFINNLIEITIVTPPAQGIATVNDGGLTLNYDATGVTAGTQAIEYEATDGTDTDRGRITITVAADVPPVTPDGTITISTTGTFPDSVSGSVTVTGLPGYIAGNAPGVITITTPPNPANGTATVVPVTTEGTIQSGANTILFQPASTFFAGTETIGYTITDIDGDTDDGVITVTVTDVSPVLADGFTRTSQDEPSVPLALGVTAGNGSLTRGPAPANRPAQHTLVVTTQAAHGQCSVAPTRQNTLLTLFTYVPNGDFVGIDTCELTLTDGDGDESTATVTITVTEAALQLPGGGSAVDPWSLALLGALPLLRRRRRS